MALLYKRRWRLKGVHSDSVLALSFNKSGKYLASASLDSRLCVWPWSSSKQEGPKFTIRGAAGFISITWVDEHTLLAGMEDGGIIVARFNKTLLVVTGFDLHRSPVECLDAKGSRIVTGAHSDVCVWDLVSVGNVFQRCTFLRRLDSPPVSGPNQHTPVVAIAVCWVPSFGANALLTSYLGHGIMIWDAVSGGALKALPMVIFSGCASLSRDERRLAVSNFTTGFDIYDTNLMTPTQKIVHDDVLMPSPPRTCLPVAFIHDGMALVGVTPSGTVGIWDWQTEQPLHTLPHEGKPPILALAAHNLENDDFVIATGTGALGDGTYIQIWQTQPTAHAELPTSAPATPTRRFPSVIHYVVVPILLILSVILLDPRTIIFYLFAT
ncbi:WD40 repeat-like protein [Pluteus cervinus]|uniref:WD40 repeat-like protein n=1 Tax=Pluteus cervinus TaxID=181527 RepID=A0ACD3AIC7_9AGAR|nr:WD40 repeat-like protein [Pluteus cervinus]